MHTVTQVWQKAALVLKEFDSDTPVIDARLLLQQVLGITREELLLEPKRMLSETEQQQFESLLERRLAHEPMSHIIGSREFYGLEFKVTPDVLTPRPDTETVVDTVLLQITENRRWKTSNPASVIRILDLGTGTGCLLLSLLHALPNARGTGVDISPQALAVAQENAEKLGLADRAEFALSRWCEKISKNYDIIVANPPYIASNAIAALMPDVADYEPHLALDGGPDGLAAYRDIARQLRPHLAEQAIVVLEIGAGQERLVADIFITEGFRLEAERSDLAGIPRCLVMTLT